ncbi:MAG: hypothetical protein AAGL24_07195 [Pseudomonadota bacterium]
MISGSSGFSHSAVDVPKPENAAVSSVVGTIQDDTRTAETISKPAADTMNAASHRFLPPGLAGFIIIALTQILNLISTIFF